MQQNSNTRNHYSAVSNEEKARKVPTSDCVYYAR